MSSYNDRGLLQLPPIENGYRGMPTGHARLLQSSSVDPSIWLSVVNYPQPPCGDLPGHAELDLGLHLQAHQARRLAAQLTYLADRIDPGGTDQPDPE